MSINEQLESLVGKIVVATYQANQGFIHTGGTLSLTEYSISVTTSKDESAYWCIDYVKAVEGNVIFLR